MGDLHEIIEVGAVERIFVLLAIAGPLVGAVIGVLIGSRRRNLRRGLTLGIGAGLLGPVNWLLWRLYNAITDHNGLDSVKNVLINIALFAGLGVGVGWIVGNRSRPQQQSDPAHKQEA